MKKPLVQLFVDNARLTGKNDLEIWEHLSLSDKIPFVENARLAGKSDQEIKQYLGLSIKPQVSRKQQQGISQQPYSDPSQPYLQPEMVTGKLPYPEQVQNPIAALLSPGGLYSKESLPVLSQGKPLTPGQAARSTELEADIAEKAGVRELERLAKQPGGGDIVIQKTANRLAPITAAVANRLNPLSNNPPYLDKAFPIAGAVGDVGNFISNIAFMGGLEGAIRKNPETWLTSQLLGGSDQAMNMVTKAVSRSAAVGAKYAGDVIAKVISGKKPTPKDLLKVPIGAAGGALIGGAHGITETLPRIGAAALAGGAYATGQHVAGNIANNLETTIPRMLTAANAGKAWDSVREFTKSGKLKPEDLQDIGMTAAVIGIVEAIGSTKLTEYYKQQGMNEYLQAKFLTQLSFRYTGNPEDISDTVNAIQDTIKAMKEANPGMPENQIIEQAVRAHTIFARDVDYVIGSQTGPKPTDITVKDKPVSEIKPKITWEEAKKVNDAIWGNQGIIHGLYDHVLDRPAFVATMKQILPEGMVDLPQGYQDQIGMNLIGNIKKGLPIDQAVGQMDIDTQIAKDTISKVTQSLQAQTLSDMLGAKMPVKELSGRLPAGISEQLIPRATAESSFADLMSQFATPMETPQERELPVKKPEIEPEKKAYKEAHIKEPWQMTRDEYANPSLKINRFDVNERAEHRRKTGEMINYDSKLNEVNFVKEGSTDITLQHEIAHSYSEQGAARQSIVWEHLINTIPGAKKEFSEWIKNKNNTFRGSIGMMPIGHRINDDQSNPSNYNWIEHSADLIASYMRGELGKSLQEVIKSVPDEGDRLFKLVQHREMIQQALEKGKKMPPEVLADYPDLQPKTEIYTAPNLKKAVQQVQTFMTRKYEYSPVAKRVDDALNEKKALTYHINQSRKEIEQAIPDKVARRDSYEYLARGGAPRNPTEQVFMDWFKEWGKRGVASKSFKHERANYVPFMLGNPPDQVKEALDLIPEDKRIFIANVDPRFSKWSGHFKPRTSPDYDAYLNGIDNINKYLKIANSKIRLYPETDMAKILDRYGRSASQKIINQELMNWLEGHFNVTTGEPLLKLSAYAIGDKNYVELPEKINLKVNWVKHQVGDEFQWTPMRYFVHKSVYNALKNYLEADLWNDSKLAQEILALKYIVRSIKLFNPIVINTKMTQRLMAHQGVKPLLNMATGRVPWHQGKQMIKSHAIVRDAIEHGLQLWEKRPDDVKEVTDREKWWQTEEEKEALNTVFHKYLNKIDNTWIRKKNDEIVTGVINATRFQMWKYLSDQFIKEGKIPGLKHSAFSVDEAKRMGAKMANDLTYAALRQEMGKDYRVLGKMIFMSRNLIHGQKDIAKRLVGAAGKGEAMFTEDQLSAMSVEERKRFGKMLFFFWLLPRLWNKKVTGKWINTEKGKRGYTALWKDDRGRVTYINSLDYVQDFVNLFMGQSEKLIGKIGFIPKQAIEQFPPVNKNLFTGKEIVSPGAGIAKNIGQRALYMAREFTPGIGNVAGIENLASLAKTIKHKGWSRTFKEFSGAQYGDFLLPFVGKFPSHGWPALPYVIEGLDSDKARRIKRRETLKNYYTTEDYEGAAQYLYEEGKTTKEVLNEIENSGKIPLTIMFKYLSPETKIEVFQKIYDDEKAWDQLTEEVQNDLYTQMRKAEKTIEKK